MGFWPRRLAVRTSGSHPENRGFDSRRGHQVLTDFKKCDIMRKDALRVYFYGIIEI